MQCGVWNQMKIWSSHLLDNLSNCLMNLKNSGDSTGFEPMTSAMPVQCSHQLSYEVTQWRAGQFVGLMFSRERNVIWKNAGPFSGRCMKGMSWKNVMILHLWTMQLSLTVWLHSSVGESTAPACRGHESPEFESPEFFRFMKQLLKLSSKCEDHIFIWL